MPKRAAADLQPLLYLPSPQDSSEALSWRARGHRASDSGEPLGATMGSGGEPVLDEELTAKISKHEPLAEEEDASLLTLPSDTVHLVCLHVAADVRSLAALGSVCKLLALEVKQEDLWQRAAQASGIARADCLSWRTTVCSRRRIEAATRHVWFASTVRGAIHHVLRHLDASARATT